MPKNRNQASVPTTDAPELKGLQEEAFSLIMKLSEEQLLIALHEVFKKEEK
jgi:hypothetical protein